MLGHTDASKSQCIDIGGKLLSLGSNFEIFIFFSNIKPRFLKTHLDSPGIDDKVQREFSTHQHMATQPGENRTGRWTRHRSASQLTREPFPRNVSHRLVRVC